MAGAAVRYSWPMRIHLFVLVQGLFLVGLCATAFCDPSVEETESIHTHSMMSAFYGGYPHTRDSSGTAWQPDSTPMEGWHFAYGDWSLMAHGFAFGTYDHQGGKRGDEK